MPTHSAGDVSDHHAREALRVIGIVVLAVVLLLAAAGALLWLGTVT